VGADGAHPPRHASVFGVFGLLATGTPDDDLIFFDQHLYWPVSGPVFGVDRIVLHGGVEPKPDPLFAVVESCLEWAAAVALTAPSCTATAPATPASWLITVIVAITIGCCGFRLSVKFGGDQSIVLGPQVDLIVKIDGGDGGVGIGIWLQRIFALEGLDLLDCDLELVCDPGVGASLTHPGADSVQLRSQRSSWHREPEHTAVGPNYLCTVWLGRYAGAGLAGMLEAW